MAKIGGGGNVVIIMMLLLVSIITYYYIKQLLKLVPNVSFDFVALLLYYFTPVHF